MTAPGPLSAFQQEVASVFFELPASEGFLLAGDRFILPRTKPHEEARPVVRDGAFTAVFARRARPVAPHR